MKKLSKIFSLALLTAVLITGCDIVEEPYLVPVTGGGTGPGEAVKKVLLEDFTGQKCPNCPDAAIVANNLQAVYGEQLIVVAVHAGFYAEPSASGDFTADYRTQAGNELNDYFSFQGYPSGLVNRADYLGSTVLFKDSWEGAVAAQVALPPQAVISFSNNYNSSTRKLDLTVETEFLEDLDGTFNLCVLITESGIVSPQQTSSGVQADYVHNHVLRAYVNGTWGDPVGTSGQAVAGEKLTNAYSITLPAEWNADHCHVVAFVYHTVSNVVVQAEEAAAVQ